MYDPIIKNIIDKKLIREGDNILVGLSGGPDSVFLFHNLRLLKESLSFNLYASHINHMYRGEDAEHDEAFVRELCLRYGVQLFVRRKNAADYARELKVTEEEAGRVLRYGFFRENLDSVGGGRIAVAHNLNDQAETVLQRIIRGAGADGLRAMTYVSGDVIRPMLNISRQEIEVYLTEQGFDWCIDKTNAQPVYGRNKIRLGLIPYLESEFNPNIQGTLCRMAEVMDGDSRIIEKYTDMLWSLAKVKDGPDEVILSLDALKRMERCELYRILRKAVGSVKGRMTNIEQKHIDYTSEFVERGATGKTVDLSEGVEALISYDTFIVRKKSSGFEDFAYDLEPEKPVFIEETGQTIVCSILDADMYDPSDKSSVSVDLACVSGCLHLRNRRAGDAMIPCGMTGRKKLKDIFIDMKIPVGDRQKRLIVTDDKNIIWVSGFRIHNDYKITPRTDKILNIRVAEEKNE